MWAGAWALGMAVTSPMQLEAKCFQQQERIEELEMKHEQEIVQTQQQEKQLLLKVDQVGVGVARWVGLGLWVWPCSSQGGGV